MRRFRNIYFALAAFLWLPASAHCLLESACGLEALQCAGVTAAAPAADHGCDETGCCAAEKSEYRAGTLRQTAPLPIVLPAPIPVQQPSAPAPALAGSTALTSAPPHLRGIWQFISRAALPVRAPSFAS